MPTTHSANRHLSESEYLNQYVPSSFEQMSVSTDAVIFGVDLETDNPNYRKLEEQKLTVLLLKRKEHPYMGKWSLPGGFVHPDNSLEETVTETVKRKTGLASIYLEQLYTFGEPKRDPRMRIISCAYMALINRQENILKAGAQIDNAVWFEVDYKDSTRIVRLKATEQDLSFEVSARATPPNLATPAALTAKSNNLAFDHANILLQALVRLRNKVEYTDIVFNLMPDTFSITNLQMVYEIILGEKLFPSAFRRKIAAKISPTGEYIQQKGHRPSQLYRYNMQSELVTNSKEIACKA